MGSIKWLGGYALMSFVGGVIAVRVFEAVTYPFFTAKSRMQRKTSSSSERGQRSQ